MFHGPEEEKTTPFQDLPLLTVELPVQIPSGFIDGPVDNGDNVVGIMNHIHMGKDLFDCLEVCRPHVHCNGTEIRSIAPELFQEGNQYRCISSLMGMQNRTGFQVDDHGHIVMTSPDGDLVNGNIANLPQLPSLELQGKVLFEDVLDHVPPDIEEAGHMLDRGDPAKVDHEPLEGLEPPLFAFGKVNGFFQITATRSTPLEMAMKNDELFAPPHRKRMEFTCERAVHDQMGPSGATMSALPCLCFLTDMMIDTATPILGLLMPVARQRQRVVKITCRRHGQSPFVPWLGNQHETYCLGGDFSIPDIVCASPTNYLLAHPRRAFLSG